MQQRNQLFHADPRERAAEQRKIESGFRSLFDHLCAVKRGRHRIAPFAEQRRIAPQQIAVRIGQQQLFHRVLPSGGIACSHKMNIEKRKHDLSFILPYLLDKAEYIRENLKEL